MRKVIYDFGSNNGDDIPYYLLKADRVVAVEANPALCARIRTRFPQEMAEGRLAVENHALSDVPDQGDVVFHVHRTNHVLSQLPAPAPEEAADFDPVPVSSITPLELIRKHGAPHYIKIDIEHFDAAILKHLFHAGVFPPYLSAEIHSAEIFCLLHAMGGYRAFKLVEGCEVAGTYRNKEITARDGSRRNHAFPLHSAGPFGDDINGPWLTAEPMLRWLGLSGCGWRDLHATREQVPTSTEFSLPRMLPGFLLRRIKQRMPKKSTR